MRQAQLQAATLPNVGFASNADHGAGCYIHPHNKRFIGTRLGNAALALVYKRPVPWESPQYASAGRVTVALGHTTVTVRLSNAGPLELRQPANAVPGLNCTAQDAVAPGTCAWGSVAIAGEGWANASVSVNGSAMLLTVPGTGKVVGTAYGWGAIPMMTVYDRSTSLPVLPWNSSWSV